MRSILFRKSSPVLAVAAFTACSSGGPPRDEQTTGKATAAATVAPRDAVLELVRAKSPVATPTIDNLQVYGGGAVVAQLSQHIDGIEVFRGGLSVVLDAAKRPLLFNGTPVAHKPTRDVAFVLGMDKAIARAVEKMAGAAPVSVASDDHPRDGYTKFAVALEPATRKVVLSARSKPVWWEGKRLQAAYYVELSIGDVDGTDSELHSFVVTAHDGAVVYEHDLVANDTFDYKVWAETSGTFVPLAGPHGAVLTPHPTGTIDSTVITPRAQVTVTLENAPFSKNDPWLSATATTTNGNNVFAYSDQNSPDGFTSGDLQPLATGKLFAHTYDPSVNPNATPDNTKAVATQLFYIANWMHDWFYDSGFDEAARNHQEDNFGRGGVSGDQLYIEAQDYSGRNNANAATPADGGNPRIQMFLFNGQGTTTLSITAPSSMAGTIATRTAQFGPSNFDITQDVVLVEDGGGASKTDGCEPPFVNAATVRGKIVLIDRGTCPFTDKSLNAEAAGAAGVIIANNVSGLPYLGATTGTAVKVPTLGVSLEDGDKIKTALMSGTVTMRMNRATAPDRDGGLDTAIVSHEWGHVLSNRLVSNGNGLRNTQGGGMGEGWSDFVSLLTIVRSSDIAAQETASWNGVYPVGSWIYGVSGTGSYFGIRRYPYSADLTKNPLTFKHIQNGTTLPKDIPVAFGEDGRYNAEVHATGEVWSAMLWQCYVNLLRDKPRLSYEEATKRMKTYLVAGLKATPRDPTIIEARDALLTAMYAADQADFKLCAKGFAERGAGTGAKGPAYTSSTNVGVTESFVTGGDFEVVELSIAEATSCDSDGVLDNGESGTLKIKLRNVGTDTVGETTGTLSSKNGKYTFASGGKFKIPAFKPFETVEATIDVTLNNAEPASQQDIDIAFESSGLAVPRTITATLPLFVDYDSVAETSATDDVEAPESTWTRNGGATTSWRLVREGINQRWTIIGTESIVDRSLTSPPLIVSADQPFTMSFSHRFAFERSRGQNFDGGVLEISTDDGKTWKDIGEPLYNGSLTSMENDNALAGRKAFSSRSAGYPEYATAKLELGTDYAGQTVKVRFRFGSDEGTASAGWDVDDIAFTGITNKPFTSKVADVTPCNAAPIDNDAGTNPAAASSKDVIEGGGCGCSTPGQTTTTVGALGALIALGLLRRRR